LNPGHQTKKNHEQDLAHFSLLLDIAKPFLLGSPGQRWGYARLERSAGRSPMIFAFHAPWREASDAAHSKQVSFWGQGRFKEERSTEEFLTLLQGPWS